MPGRWVVPLADPAAEYNAVRDEADQAISRVLSSGRYEQGSEVEAFEEEMASYCGVRHAVATSSGTAAIFLVLKACGVGQGDLVLTAPNSDVSTTAAVSHAGGMFCLVDVDRRTYCLDPDLTEQVVRERGGVRALVPVHMYGHPADMGRLGRLAREHGLLLIEDACIALGAEYEGRRVGTFGAAGCFSFAPRKMLGGLGDGGVVVTDDDELAYRVRLLRGYGREPGYRGELFWHVAEGYNLRMSEVEAAFLRVKLRHLERWIARRREIARTYGEMLRGLPLELPGEVGPVRHVWRNYVVLVRERDAFRERMAALGVETGLHYAPPVHLQPVYACRREGRGSYPVAEEVGDRIVCLPIYPAMTDAQVEYVVGAVRRSLSGDEVRWWL